MPLPLKLLLINSNLTKKRRSLERGASFFFLFAALLFHGCAPSPLIARPETGRILEGVPFFPQEAYQCGPASLASVLNYWGLPISPEEIAEEIFSKGARGTLNLDMFLYVQRKGLKANQDRGSPESLKRDIDAGRPVIVLVDLGFWVVRQGHYMVVFGYGKQGVIVHSGREQRKLIPWTSFLKSWEKTKFWMLRITPS
jgi:ABC-type bacteriocin/lantibiotic exporter with double-glycine peptidase domain